MFELCGVDVQSQAAFELAVQGPLRPAVNKVPLIYSFRCIDFKKPHFTIGNSMSHTSSWSIHRLNIHLHFRNSRNKWVRSLSQYFDSWYWSSPQVSRTLHTNSLYSSWPLHTWRFTRSTTLESWKSLQQHDCMSKSYTKVSWNVTSAFTNAAREKRIKKVENNLQFRNLNLSFFYLAGFLFNKIWKFGMRLQVLFIIIFYNN